MATVNAKINYLHVAPRKVRAAAKLLKGMDITKAKSQLSYLIKRSSEPLIKVLDSAVANAKNNFSMLEDNLFIKEIKVNEGVAMKRYKPRGFGRVYPIKRKTSNVEVVLEEKIHGLKAKSSVKSKKTEREEIKEKIEKSQLKEKRAEKEIGKKERMGKGGLIRRFFRRKTI